MGKGSVPGPDLDEVLGNRLVGLGGVGLEAELFEDVVARPVSKVGVRVRVLLL